MVAALCLAALAATPNASSADESSMPSPVEAMSIAVDAYVYGYPLVTFTRSGPVPPRNAIAVAVLFLGALSLSGAIFLIEELNDPLGGIISISRAPMETALGYIGK